MKPQNFSKNTQNTKKSKIFGAPKIKNFRGFESRKSIKDFLGNKKTGKIMMLMVLIISLAMPMVLASDIQNFLTDMKAHPSNYYVWHDMTNTWANRSDLGMLIAINNFASSFGVSTSNVEIPGKNAVIFSFPGASFAVDKNYSTFLSPISFAETIINSTEHPGINYTLVYVTYDKGDYDEFISRLNGTESEKVYEEVDINNNSEIEFQEIVADNLKTLLNFLLTYQTNPIEMNPIEVGWREVFGEESPTFITCSEFNESDKSVWYKDEYFYRGQLYVDQCLNEYVLAELECTNTSYIAHQLYNCPIGCSYGRCIWSFPFLVYESEEYQISELNFYDSITAWLDSVARRPTCTETCENKGYYCGVQSICGIQTLCGICNKGYTCSADGKTCSLD